MSRLLLFLACIPFLAATPTPPGHGELAAEPLVEIAKADPTIVIDLRYATDRNITGHPIYPAGTTCMVRSGVMERLKQVQTYLRYQGFGLKIWDAYRPAYAQNILWEKVKNPEVVADPSKGGSKHSWGVAVDVTLVDLEGHDVLMPTDFDDFTAAAKDEYKGGNPVVAENLRVLKNAMLLAGFEGMRDEWWHFSVKNWQSYGLVILPANAPDAKPAVVSASPSPLPSATPVALTGSLPPVTVATPVAQPSASPAIIVSTPDPLATPAATPAPALLIEPSPAPAPPVQDVPRAATPPHRSALH